MIYGTRPKGNGQQLSAAYGALTTFLGGLQHVLVVSQGYFRAIRRSLIGIDRLPCVVG